jgi:Protein of unknown function (DUF3237)
VGDFGGRVQFNFVVLTVVEAQGVDDKGEPVDPGSYYFRMTPIFETAAPQYDWINRLIAVGVGHRLPDGPLYSIFEVL